MPETYELIAQARNVLADLYSDQMGARMLAYSAGLDLRQIAFTGQAYTTWQAILEEAQKQGRLLAILDEALKHYNAHPDLQRVRAAWTEHERASAEPVRPLIDPAELATLKRRLASARSNLALIEERKAEYVLEVDVPLQLVREERSLRERIADLERQIAEQ